MKPHSIEGFTAFAKMDRRISDLSVAVSPNFAVGVNVSGIDVLRPGTGLGRHSHDRTIF